jgi:hypothetical protein
MKTGKTPDLATIRKLAMTFPEVSEEPHFEKPSFRIRKKIFVTIDLKNNRACVKLSITEQDLFSLFDKTVVYPVPNKWGQQGWTFIELNRVPLPVFNDLLLAAYCTVAPAKLAEQVRPTGS